MSIKRSIMAAVMAAVLTVAVTAVASAQWPTSCVDLNDIAEGHLGNDGNVGIYQTTFGDQAEAACQNDHRDDVVVAFYWAVMTFVSHTGQVVSVPFDRPAAGTDATTGWPVTCVGLNDVVEGHLGNAGNVGIYQAAFGDQAEPACQNDHRNDVQLAFDWAKGTMFLDASGEFTRFEWGKYQPVSLAPLPAEPTTPQAPGFVLHYSSPGNLAFVVDLPANAHWVWAGGDDASIQISELGELNTRINWYEPDTLELTSISGTSGVLLAYPARYLIDMSDYDGTGWQVKFGASRNDLGQDTQPIHVPVEALFTGKTHKSYDKWYGYKTYTTTFKKGRLTDIYSCRGYDSGGYFCD